jgi:hypothetical protein
MAQFPCPYLKGGVDLIVERDRHLAERHPDLLPAHYDLVATTLAAPDLVRRSPCLGNARLFSRRFDHIRGGKHVVVVVVSDPAPDRRLAEGETEWQRN